jgi:hypothetical protein
MGSCLNCWAFGFHTPLNSCTMRGLTFCTSLKKMRETKQSFDWDTRLPEPRYHKSTQLSLGIRQLHRLTIRLLFFLFKRMLIISLSSLCDNTIIESLQISGHTTYHNGFLSIQLDYLSQCKLTYTCIAKKAHSKKDKESMLRSKIINNYVLIILFLHMILDIELSLHKMVITTIIIITTAAKSITLLSSGN